MSAVPSFTVPSGQGTGRICFVELHTSKGNAAQVSRAPPPGQKNPNSQSVRFSTGTFLGSELRHCFPAGHGKQSVMFFPSTRGDSGMVFSGIPKLRIKIPVFCEFYLRKSQILKSRNPAIFSDSRRYFEISPCLPRLTFLHRAGRIVLRVTHAYARDDMI